MLDQNRLAAGRSHTADGSSDRNCKLESVEEDYSRPEFPNELADLFPSCKVDAALHLYWVDYWNLGPGR